MDDLKEKKYSENVWNTLWRKSPTELRIIFREATAKLTTVPQTMGFSEKMAVEAELAAAIDILKEKDRRQTEDLKAEWKNIWAQSYLSLKEAYTPNGQLIAAILEDEDGKTLEEIMNWSDETLVFEQGELLVLLNNLIDDGVIELQNDGKYYLLRTCDSSLSFEHSGAFKKWADKKIEKSSTNKLSNRSAKLRMHIWSDFFFYHCCEELFYKEDLFEWVDYQRQSFNNDKSIYESFGDEESKKKIELLEKPNGIDGWIIMVLNELVSNGIIRRDLLGRHHITMLGE